jgi:predicted amidohydrolase YtcJ
MGDAATRYALDALEAAGTVNKHAITHLGLVAQEDFKRFGDLGVIASISPYWFCKNPTWNVTEQRILGLERSERMFPAKSFFDADAVMVAGSDYPVTGFPHPLLGIDMAVTRSLPIPFRGDLITEAYILNPDEAITLEQAVHAFTLAPAWSFDLHMITGSIEAHKYADFVILDKDIFTTELYDTIILETWFRGKQVYEQSGQ